MTTIKLKNGSGAPAGGDLVQGEPALDLTNKRLYTENASGTVIEVGTNPTSVTTGDVVATSLDISGNIDVDGTTNLDVVDIDGAVDMASTLAVGGVVTANAGVVVDNITIDGQEIDVSSGDLTLDVAGDIILDTGGDDIKFKVGGTDFGSIAYSNSNLLLTSAVSNGDILLKGNDGGSTITALTLNMSEAGEATFNSDILLGDGKVARFGTDQDFRIGFDGSTATLHNVTSDSDILFKGNDGGSAITALTLDMSAAGYATFNDGINVNGTVTANNLTMGDDEYIRLGNSNDFVIVHSGSENIIQAAVSDQDIIFKGNDGGSTITALSLDMSAAGAATFNAGVTATGLEVEAATPVIEIDSTTSANLATLQFTTSGTVDSKITHQASTGVMTIDSGRNASWGGKIDFVTDTDTRMRIANNGDISFYEDTGTTAKLFWDASAESLGIGTSSPSGKIHSVAADAQVAVMAAGDVSDPLYPAFGFDGQIGSNGGRGAGMYLPSDSTLAFSTAGSERMRIDSSGNVGIGTTSPFGRLSVDVVAGAPASSGNMTNGFTIHNSNGGRAIQLGVNETGSYNYLQSSYVNNANVAVDMAFFTGATEAMRIDSSGNVGIGVTPESWNTYKTLQIGNGAIANYTPTHDMRIVSNAYYNSGWKYAESDGACLYLQDGDNSAHIWSVAASGTADAALTWSEAMRIDSSGNLLVGTTTSAMTAGGVRLKNGGGNLGEIALSNNSGSADYVARFLWGSSPTLVGNITVSASATAFNTSSDQRLKDNIVDAPSASDDIDAIQVRSFDWKADGSHQKYGMVAQELNTVAPEAVSAPEDPEDMLGVDYSKLVPMLVKEIQSLRARVAQLETN